MCVFVATMANQLSTSHKGHVTVCALVWTSSCINTKQNFDMFNNTIVLPTFLFGAFDENVGQCIPVCVLRWFLSKVTVLKALPHK